MLRTEDLGRFRDSVLRHPDRVIRTTEQAGDGVDQNERYGALGIRRGEQDRHGGSLSIPNNHGALRLGSIHDGKDVLHP